MKTESAETVTDIIETLEHVRKRPLMYLAKSDYSNALSLILGFRLALKVFSIFPDFEIHYQQTLIQHDVHDRHMAPCQIMVLKGYSDDEVTYRLLSIEINTWEKLLPNYLADNQG